MREIPVKVRILRKEVLKKGWLPDYATPLSSGMDVYAVIEDDILIRPHQITVIPTGISVAVPEGYEIQVRPRSGLALKYGVSLPNTPGTVDADYRGEIKVILINLGAEEFIIHPGDRIAQIVLTPVFKIKWEIVDDLPETGRGKGGFGHTGI